MEDFKGDYENKNLKLAGVVFNAASDYLPEEALAKSTVRKIAAQNSWYVFTREVSYSRSYPKGAREGRPIFRNFLFSLEQGTQFRTVCRRICREGRTVTRTEAYELLRDLAQLVKKYGPNVFDDLATLLRSPETSESLLRSWKLQELWAEGPELFDGPIRPTKEEAPEEVCGISSRRLREPARKEQNPFRP